MFSTGGIQKVRSLIVILYNGQIDVNETAH
jgi:hypothetical protein